LPLLARLFSSLLFLSCQENKGLENELLVNNEKFVLPDGQVLSLNPKNILEYIDNEEDLDDNRIRTQRYEIGLLVRELFVDKKFNKVLIDIALTKANTAVSLQSFVNENGFLKSDGNIKQEIFTKLQTILCNMDFTHRSTNPLKKGEIEEYIPAIFLVNPELADFSKQPFITPGVAVNSEIAGLGKFDDYIVAWIADEDGDFHEVLINEEFAMTTNHPIFSVDNAENEMLNRKRAQNTFSSLDLSTKNPSTAWYSTHEYRINYRYESNGDSEFTITAARIDPNGGANLVLRNDNSTVTLFKEIASVDKDDVGKDLERWMQFCSEAPIPFEQNFIFFNTYERDWWESDKSLGQATRNGTTIYLSGRRPSSSE
jgi:hypothetical protein